MSSDQQYPHGQQYGYGDGHGDGRYGQQPPYAGPESHGEQQSYGDGQSYGDRQGYGHAPYDPRGAGTPAPGTPAGTGWPAHQGQRPPASADQGQADQGATQTWQGQTWDTQYQPTVQRAQDRPPQPQVPPTPRARHGAPATGAVGGHPQAPGARRAYPLPPEVPAGPRASGSGSGPAHAAPAPDAVLGGAGYSSPTTVGNSRITDAQRARAEGRSPVIAPGMQPAAITAGLGLLLALGAGIGPYALLVPLVLLQAVTAAGWFRLNGMWPARQGIALAFAGGLVADAVLLAAGRENAPAAIVGTLGVWVLLTFVLQLRSRAGADERMYGLMASVASASLAVLAAGHLAAVPDAVTVGAVAVAVAVLARALPLPGMVSVVAALVVAAGAGGAMGAFTDFGAQGAFLGFAAGGCALIGLRVASYDYPSRFVHMTAGVALPLTAAAPAVYLIGRAIG